MKNIITVLKKELRRFFTDYRMLLSICLPGVMIFLIYTVLGDVITEMAYEEKTEFVVYVENEPKELPLFNVDGWTFRINEEELTKEEILSGVKSGTIDLYVVYEEGFFNKVTVDNVISNVEIYYNSLDAESSTMYAYVTAALDSFESTLSNKFDINSKGQIYDLSSQEDMSKQIIGMILPFILTIFLFSGAMGICCESIAGEKERGTIATLLVTPVKRSHLVVGKIGALGITTMVSALVSFTGLISSLPKLIGTDFSLDLFDVPTLLMILLVVVISALLFTTILTIVSTYAKSVKEATSLAAPLTLIISIVGMSGMMTGDTTSNLLVFLIPVYNSIQCFSSILSSNIDSLAVIITVVANIGYISLGVLLLTKMFNSEKIMFNK